MKPCRSAGAQCPREAVLTARIAGNGDVPLCRDCCDTYIAMGMDLRILEPNAFVPKWRRGLAAKDLTGTVLA